MRLSTVFVGTTNPGKLNAVRQAFKQYADLKTSSISGVRAASHVPEQPIGFQDTTTGAKMRSLQAHRLAVAAFESGSRDTAIEEAERNRYRSVAGLGLESGLVRLGEEVC